MKHVPILLVLMNVAAFAAEKIPLPTAHTTRNIEGWTVRVDNRLLHGDSAAVGDRALRLLESRLVAITFVVPEKSLAKLRAIAIQLDLNYGDLRPMQYHPDAGWLKEHGYSEKLAKCVHIPEVEDFLEPTGIHRRSLRRQGRSLYGRRRSHGPGHGGAAQPQPIDT